jgi:MFS family permease
LLWGIDSAVAPIAGVLSDRIGPRPVMATGMFLQAVGLASFALLATAGAGHGPLILPLLIAGIGVSMPFATVGSAVLSAVAPSDMGKASGTNSTVLTFGGAFGIAVVTAVFAAYSHIGTPAGFIVGLRPALGLAAGLASLGAVTALAAGSRHAPARIHIEAPVATSEQADDAFSPAWECCVVPRRSLVTPGDPLALASGGYAFDDVQFPLDGDGPGQVEAGHGEQGEVLGLGAFPPAQVD